MTPVSLTIYEHVLKPYTKLSRYTAKLSNIPGKRNVLIIGKKYNITVSQYAIILNAHFEQVSNKKKICETVCVAVSQDPAQSVKKGTSSSRELSLCLSH